MGSDHGGASPHTVGLGESYRYPGLRVVNKTTTYISFYLVLYPGKRTTQLFRNPRVLDAGDRQVNNLPALQETTVSSQFI